MLDPRVANVVGTPHASVTHWGIYRKRETPYASGRDKWLTLDHPDESGVLQKLWPLAELSPATVRERWGPGTFQVYWVRLDPENPQPEHRRTDQGKGVVFGIKEMPKEEADDDDDDEPRGATDPLAFAMRYADEQAKRTMSQFEAFARLAGINSGGSGADSAALAAIAELRAELAEQRARAEAAEERRKIEDAHRRDLEAKEQEIARLRRELEDDRRDRDDDAAPRFVPGVPIMEQILPAAANLAMSKPEAFAALVAAAGPLLRSFVGGGAPSAPPPAPPPPAMPAPRPIPVAVAQPMPRAPVATPIGQVFVPPAPAAVAAPPVATPIGQIFPLPTPPKEAETAPALPGVEAVAEPA